jgi:hypothetical protein
MRSPTRRPLALVPAACVFALAALSGCESYRAPDLSLAETKPVQRTEAGTALHFGIDAQNDNDVALPLREITYTLAVDGKPVFTATRSPEATLRRQGSQRIVLPAVVPSEAGAVNPGSRFRLSGAMTYVTPGQIAEILFDSGVRVPSVGFSFEGEVPPGP